jgi:hypothetical protein
MRKLVLLLLVFAIARSDGFAGWIFQWQFKAAMRNGSRGS